MTTNHSMSDAILEQTKQLAYEEGAKDAISWLEEVYGDGLHQTDAYKEYFGSCECCADYSNDDEEETN